MEFKKNSFQSSEGFLAFFYVNKKGGEYISLNFLEEKKNYYDSLRVLESWSGYLRICTISIYDMEDYIAQCTAFQTKASKNIFTQELLRLTIAESNSCDCLKDRTTQQFSHQTDKQRNVQTV